MEERDALNGLSDALREMRGELARAASNNNRTDINLHGGGVGVWIAATACLVMLTASLFMALQLYRHDQKISDLEAYLSAIYMQAPHLKPVEKEK